MDLKYHRLVSFFQKSTELKMAKLKLTVACDKYDYLQPLREGKVLAEGIDLNLITVESGIRHQRMYHYGEYDACEFSMSSYLVCRLLLEKKNNASALTARCEDAPSTATPI